jgi:hypothetical protein
MLSRAGSASMCVTGFTIVNCVPHAIIKTTSTWFRNNALLPYHFSLVPPRPSLSLVSSGGRGEEGGRREREGERRKGEACSSTQLGVQGIRMISGK